MSLQELKEVSKEWFHGRVSVSRSNVKTYKRLALGFRDAEMKYSVTCTKSYFVNSKASSDDQYVEPNEVISGQFSKRLTRVSHLTRILTGREANLWIVSSWVQWSTGVEQNIGLLIYFTRAVAIQFFFGKSENSPVQIDIQNLTHELGDYDPQFTQKQLSAVFRSLNRRKEPGVDWLPLERVEFLYRAYKPLFFGLINKCLREGLFPSSWRSQI